MKNKSIALFCILLISGLVFSACIMSVDTKITTDSSPFAGTWTNSLYGDVKVIITETEFLSTVDGDTYNGGTYTYTGKTAIFTITDPGTGSAKAGTKGNANIDNGKLVLENFFDDNMNGTYIK